MLRYNSKYQTKGPIYILHLLAFEAIRLFKFMYIERQKPGFGKAMMKCGRWDFREKEWECGIRIEDDSSVNKSTEEGQFFILNMF